MYLQIIIIILTLLSVLGFIYKPVPKQVYINPNVTPIDPVCQNQPVECDTDNDCNKCIDNEKMNCVIMNRNKNQEEKYGKAKKYCLPLKPSQPCNETLGGIWTWTGWSDPIRKEWDCLCTYPEIAGNKGCTKLNPNVCKNGVYKYNAINAIRGPSPKDCECASNSQRIITSTNVPLCVPKGDGYCANEQMCTNFYT